MPLSLADLLLAIEQAPDITPDLTDVEIEPTLASVLTEGQRIQAMPAGPDMVAAVRRLTTANALIRAESDRRAAAQAEQTAAAESLAGLLAAGAPAPPAAAPVPVVEPNPVIEDPNLAASAPVAVTASAAPTASGVSSLGVPATGRTRRRTTLLASAEAGGTQAGEITFSDLGPRLEAAMQHRWKGYDHVSYDTDRRTPGPGSGVVIASADVFDGNYEGMLTDGAPAQNTLSLWGSSRSNDEKAVLAAAGFDCGPNDRDLSMPDGWRQDTPFVDMFPKRPLGTMSYDFYRTDILSAIFPGGTGNPGAVIWTNANQEAVDPADSTTWKPANIVPCTQTPITEHAWAVVAIATTNTFQQFSLLPVAENFQRALNTQRARVTESKAMAKFRSDCFLRSATAPLGGVAGLLEVLESEVSGQYWAERLNPETFDLALPDNLRRVMRTDLRNRGFGNDATNLNSFIDEKIREAGFPTVVWYLDDYTGRSTPTFAAVGSTLTSSATKVIGRQNGLGTTHTIYLVPTKHYHIGQRPIMNQRALMPGFADARQNAVASIFETAMSLGRHGTVRGTVIEHQLTGDGSRTAMTFYKAADATTYGTDIAPEGNVTGATGGTGGTGGTGATGATGPTGP